jgi:hypothetical protein
VLGVAGIFFPEEYYIFVQINGQKKYWYTGRWIKKEKLHAENQYRRDNYYLYQQNEVQVFHIFRSLYIFLTENRCQYLQSGVKKITLTSKFKWKFLWYCKVSWFIWNDITAVHFIICDSIQNTVCIIGICTSDFRLLWMTLRQSIQFMELAHSRFILINKTSPINFIFTITW